jgi:hypothetical protein
VHLRDLMAWPPIPLSLKTDGGRVEGVFRRCEFIPRSWSMPAHLEVAVEYGRQVLKAVYWHPSEHVLHRIVETLNSRPGALLRATAWFELGEGAG